MKNKYKFIIALILSSLFILVIIGFGAYVYKLHTIAVEGNKIFEQRCLAVNPPLISYKNSFLKFADYLQNPGRYSEDEGIGFYFDYIAGMRKYIEEETKWLETDRKYLDRWDFKLIEPWYIKQDGEYQWKMYEGYRDDAKYLLEPFDKKTMTPENEVRMKEAKSRRDKYAQLYFDHFEKASKIDDWRKIFGNVSIPKGCNEENLTIPNTTGAIDWGDESPSSSPTITPTESTSPLI